MAAKCRKTVLQRGKWVKQHLQWAVAVVRVLRLLPTLPLFSRVWSAYLERLHLEEEHDLVTWLRSYERPLPFMLQQKYRDQLPTYVSFWTSTWKRRWKSAC